MHRLFSLIAASILFASNPAAAAVEIGAAAPDFSATDINGAPVKLSALKGKVVVLEWTNHQCPFVVKHYKPGNMQAVQKAAKEQGAIWIAINSSAAGKEGHLADGAAAQAVVKEQGSNATHIILDAAGAIGKLYGAKTTPHMFVIDANGALAYMGAIDSKATASSDDIKDATNYVTNAVASLVKGVPVEPASTQPYGCSVKY